MPLLNETEGRDIIEYLLDLRSNSMFERVLWLGSIVIYRKKGEQEDSRIEISSKTYHINPWISKKIYGSIHARLTMIQYHQRQVSVVELDDDPDNKITQGDCDIQFIQSVAKELRVQWHA